MTLKLRTRLRLNVTQLRTNFRLHRRSRDGDRDVLVNDALPPRRVRRPSFIISRGVSLFSSLSLYSSLLLFVGFLVVGVSCVPTRAGRGELGVGLRSG